MRIVILGAGAIGCFVGGAWLASGLDVRLIGRRRVADEIAVHGLRLTDWSGLDIALPAAAVPFSTSPEALSQADLVVVAVKGTGTATAGDEIARHAPADAAVLSLQNGISHIDRLGAALPGRTVLRGIVGYNVARTGPGHWHRGTSGRLMVERHPMVQDLARRLSATPGALELTDDALGLAWGKLLLNLNNAVNALSGRTLREELSQRPYRRVLAASMREALEVLAAAGIRPAKVSPLPPGLLPGFIGLPDFIFNPVGLRLQKIDAHARSSMADDFATDRATEIDFLNGEIVRLAAQVGQAAPINERIVRLVKEAESGGRRDWPGEELVRAVLG